MTHQPKTVRVVHDNSAAAERYRLIQAEALLREAGFVRRDDGTWHPDDAR